MSGPKLPSTWAKIASARLARARWLSELIAGYKLREQSAESEIERRFYRSVVEDLRAELKAQHNRIDQAVNKALKPTRSY